MSFSLFQNRFNTFPSTLDLSSDSIINFYSTSADIKKDFTTLANELKAFNNDLPKKPTIVAVTKLDIADTTLRKVIKKLKFARGISLHCISAVSGEGLNDLVAGMWKAIEKKKGSP